MLANNGAEISHSLVEMSDEWLVVAAKDGNVDAFAELRARHFRTILRTTYRITRNWEDAEDAVQDSFLKVFVHLNSFEGRSSFLSWATRIAINISLMLLRKRRSHDCQSLDAWDHYVGFDDRWEIRDPREDPERFCARYERSELLREAILRLRPCLRNAVELRYSKEYSMKEIADSLGISLASAKSRLCRARLSLRILLRDDNLRSYQSEGTLTISAASLRQERLSLLQHSTPKQPSAERADQTNSHYGRGTFMTNNSDRKITARY
jgi:RNA polymerase sigma-70 factor (ECF subfamily)